MRKLVYGVGVNDADYAVSQKVNGKPVWCPFYRAWQGMLKRCYSEKYQQRNPTYKGCTVCDEWVNSFMVFRAWMIQQPWQGNQLDKDLVGEGKTYSPDTCRFIPQWLNSLFTDAGSIRGDLPQGVSKHGNRYAMKLSINGKQMNKYYSTVAEASAAYLTAKEAHVRSFYALLDDDLIQGCEVHLAYIRYPTLKALCR